MRVLVGGGRDYADRKKVFDTLDSIRKELGTITIIHGGASGADALALAWAMARGFDSLQFKADWNKHGRAAGPIRNQQMLDEGHPDLVIAFPGGCGTADMVRRARASGIEVRGVTA